MKRDTMCRNQPYMTDEIFVKLLLFQFNFFAFIGLSGVVMTYSSHAITGAEYFSE